MQDRSHIVDCGRNAGIGRRQPHPPPEPDCKLEETGILGHASPWWRREFASTTPSLRVALAGSRQAGFMVEKAEVSQCLSNKLLEAETGEVLALISRESGDVRAI